MGVWLFHLRAARNSKAFGMDATTIVALVTLTFLGAGVGGMVRALLGLYVPPWSIVPCVGVSRQLARAIPLHMSSDKHEFEEQLQSLSTTAGASDLTAIAPSNAVRLPTVAEPAGVGLTAAVSVDVWLPSAAAIAADPPAAPTDAYMPASSPPDADQPAAAPIDATSSDAKLPAAAATDTPTAAAPRALLPAPACVGTFPASTFISNCVGSFILGLLSRLSSKLHWSPMVLAAVGTGFCGGLTTMSTFVNEVIVLFAAGNASSGVIYWFATQAACLALSLLGWTLGSLAGSP